MKAVDHSWIAALGCCVVLVVAVASSAQQPSTFQAGVGLVLVECSASKGGRPVTGARPEDFILLDDGRPRVIEHLWRDTDLPLTVGLVADVSGSQSEFVGQHRQTLALFLSQVLRPRDRAFLVTVAHDVRLVTDFTSSVEELQRGADSIGANPTAGTQLGDCVAPPLTVFFQHVRSFCSTALWNGVYFSALRKMRPVSGRKALVVLTDGLDRTSPHSLSEAILAAQEADTRVYAIQYLVFRDHIPFGPTSMAGTHLRRLAGETGGRLFNAPEGGSAEIFSQIEEELRAMYVLGFRLPEEGRDGQGHRLEVKWRHGGVEVRARKRYVAETTANPVSPPPHYSEKLGQEGAKK